MFSYWAKPTDALDLSRRLNDHIAEVVRDHPTSFAGLGTIPMQDPDLAAGELERCVRELGLRGAEIGTHVDANPHFGRVDTLNLDNAALQPVWSAAEELSSTDARIDGKSTRWNSAAFDGEGCGVPTRCTIVSAAVTPERERRRVQRVADDGRGASRGAPADSARTSARTRWPRARAPRSGVARCRPVEPVTKTSREVEEVEKSKSRKVS